MPTKGHWIAAMEIYSQYFMDLHSGAELRLDRQLTKTLFRPVIGQANAADELKGR